jgi:hypothetical protein
MQVLQEEVHREDKGVKLVAALAKLVFQLLKDPLQQGWPRGQLFHQLKKSLATLITAGNVSLSQAL